MSNFWTLHEYVDTVLPGYMESFNLTTTGVLHLMDYPWCIASHVQLILFQIILWINLKALHLIGQPRCIASYGYPGAHLVD